MLSHQRHTLRQAPPLLLAAHGLLLCACACARSPPRRSVGIPRRWNPTPLPPPPPVLPSLHQRLAASCRPSCTKGCLPLQQPASVPLRIESSSPLAQPAHGSSPHQLPVLPCRRPTVRAAHYCANEAVMGQRLNPSLPGQLASQTVGYRSPRDAGRWLHLREGKPYSPTCIYGPHEQ